MIPVEAGNRSGSRPVSTFVERLFSRLPRSFASLIVSVLIIKSVVATITVGIAHYVTHDQLPTTVLWDGGLKIRSLVVMLLLAPPIETFVLLSSAFLVSWFSPLSPSRATPGQLMIGVGLIFSVLEAAIIPAYFLRGMVHGALFTHVYLHYRRRSLFAGAGMVLVFLSVQNCVMAALSYSFQRWSS